MGVTSYQDLVVWQRAMDLVVMVYELTQGFPKEELYGLTSQLRRAAVSVPSNIAEGHGRCATQEFLHFLAIANGSLKELETQILIAQRLGYANPSTATKILNQTSEVGRINRGLMASLKRKRQAP
jgi:four helix bundle protein